MKGWEEAEERTLAAIKRDPGQCSWNQEKAGYARHQEARDAMKGRWRHPKRSMDWYRDMKVKFADLPES